MTGHVIFRAALPSGEVLTGPIQGNGGFLGSGSLYQGLPVAQRAASKMLILQIMKHGKGKPLDIPEPSPGHVIMETCKDPNSSWEERMKTRVNLPLMHCTWGIEKST